MSVKTIISIFLTAFLAAMYVKDILLLITDFIFAPLFRLRIKMVSFFGLSFILEEEGKWKASFTKKIPLIQHNVLRDTRKPFESFSEKDSVFLNIIEGISLVSASTAVCFAFRELFFKSGKTVAEYFAVGFACGMLFFCVKYVLITLYVQLIIMKRLGGYVEHLIDRLRQGETFSALDLKPVSELGFKNPSPVEEEQYYMVYMGYLAETGNTEAMRQPSHMMLERLRERDFILQDGLKYYWLIYYFSDIEPDKANADLLLRKIENVIYSDNLPNAKRVLAYYAFDHEHDLEHAEELVSEGFAALEAGTFTNAERILERSLLTQLNTRIIKAKFNTDTRLSWRNIFNGRQTFR